MVTVGQAVMDIKGRLRLPVANGQPELGQNDSLWSRCIGGYGGRIVELHHFYAGVNQVIDDELMPPVESGSIRSPRRGYASSSASKAFRQGVDVHGTFQVCAQTHKIMGLANISSLHAACNRRRCKHLRLPPRLADATTKQSFTRTCPSIPIAIGIAHAATMPTDQSSTPTVGANTGPPTTSTRRFDGIAHRLMLDDRLNPLWELVEGHKAAAEEHEHSPYDLGALHDDGARGVQRTCRRSP